MVTAAERTSLGVLKHIFIHRKAYLYGVLTCLLFFATLKSAAQNDDFLRVRISVSLDYGGKTKYGTVRYAKFKTVAQMNNAKAELEKAIKAETYGAIGEREKAERKTGIEWKTSSANGVFSFLAMVGQGVIVIADDDMEAFEIQRGKTDYQVKIDMKHSKEGVEVVAKGRSGPMIKNVPSIDDGYQISFNINLALPKGFATDQSRLIIQPAAVDCQTEDTISFLKPIVLESEEYHVLQNRRMDYDYHANDPLARGYSSSITLKSGEPLTFDTTIVYRKPDQKKVYKGSYACALEDYHHVIWRSDEATGSCLSFRPFKFLDFGVASAELPLSAEFQQTPEENFQTIPRNLRLKFVVGKDELSSDSLNTVELNKLVKELKSYGNRLMQVRISGSSSPEGLLQLNQTLAEKRAAKALRLLRGYLSRDIRVGTDPAKVYTWKDVLDGVEQLGDTVKTAMVRNIIDNNKESDVFSLLSKLPFYEADILPILENQRVMKCSYIYETQHVMDETEVVAAYYENKKQLLSGEKDFSDGDYFNLFAAITDSLELDTVTILAYRHIVRQPGYVNLKFAPYAANRMALMNIRKGTPDTQVLAPFIDYTVKRIDFKRRVDDYNSMTVNRSEILVNQTINYFQEHKLDTAYYILNDWLPSTPTIQKLRAFVRFSKDYVPYIQDRLPASDRQAIEEAERYVFNANPDNRAIIYTELHSQLGVGRSECDSLVSKMSDTNPKKWYLLGILKAEEQERADISHGDGGGMDDADEPSDIIPDYLAYFQHSFDMEKKYKGFYFNEANVNDKLRKRYPYRRKNIPKYREMFENLTAKHVPDAVNTPDETGQEPTSNE